MHLQKGKKILIYLFLFLIVGSINNIALTKINFEKIKSIQISGLNQNQNINLLENIKELKIKNIFFLKGKEISKIISSNSLVENYEIFKKYPYALDIKIERTDFLAKINKNGKTFLIGTNGKLSDVKFKRPGFGIAPRDIKKILNKKVIKEIQKDRLIKVSHLK